MSRPLVCLAALVLLAGCRLEPAEPPTAPADSLLLGTEEGPPETDPDRHTEEPTPDPPVAAGDTARVTPEVAAVADPPGEAAVTESGWVIPVVGVEPGDLVDTFTAARSEGRTHNAIDILAPRGTPVVAAAAGTVQRLFTSEKGGLTVYVLGDDEQTVHYYAHLDAYAEGLAEGQRIARGGAIGTVGDTGNAQPGNYHLHFAVWAIEPGASFWDGEPINPYDLLVR